MKKIMFLDGNLVREKVEFIMVDLNMNDYKDFNLSYQILSN